MSTVNTIGDAIEVLIVSQVTDLKKAGLSDETARLTAIGRVEAAMHTLKNAEYVNELERENKWLRKNNPFTSPMPTRSLVSRFGTSSNSATSASSAVNTEVSASGCRARRNGRRSSCGTASTTGSGSARPKRTTRTET